MMVDIWTDINSMKGPWREGVCVYACFLFTVGGRGASPFLPRVCWWGLFTVNEEGGGPAAGG
jgi:hypothetical protein